MAAVGACTCGGAAVAPAAVSESAATSATSAHGSTNLIFIRPSSFAGRARVSVVSLLGQNTGFRPCGFQTRHETEEKDGGAAARGAGLVLAGRQPQRERPHLDDRRRFGAKPSPGSLLPDGDDCVVVAGCRC